MKIVVLKFLLYFILFFVISDWNLRKPEISAYWSIRIINQAVAIFPSQKLIITDLATYRSILKLFDDLSQGHFLLSSSGRPYSNIQAPSSCSSLQSLCDLVEPVLVLKPSNPGSDMFYSFIAVTLLQVYLGASQYVQ